MFWKRENAIPGKEVSVKEEEKYPVYLQGGITFL